MKQSANKTKQPINPISQTHLQKPNLYWKKDRKLTFELKGKKGESKNWFEFKPVGVERKEDGEKGVGGCFGLSIPIPPLLAPKKAQLESWVLLLEAIRSVKDVEKEKDGYWEVVVEGFKLPPEEVMGIFGWSFWMILGFVLYESKFGYLRGVWRRDDGVSFWEGKEEEENVEVWPWKICVVKACGFDLDMAAQVNFKK